ncbi:MAG: 1-deoxy-D-xylulose-5-phosphate reductoisomerase, partial [Methylophilaceae bacterium]|nr:1-deoxy-D-xylulose-5-phosphate reductoisomerase [Methylophilaceae bacterium]
VLAQLGNPDMRTPIAYGLAYPNRIDSGVKSLDFLSIAKLAFEAPDTKRFPCLQLAFDALNAGGTASTILNAANEIAVAAFLKEQIGFKGISDLIAEALNHFSVEAVSSIEHLIEVDAMARQYASKWIAAFDEQTFPEKVRTC